MPSDFSNLKDSGSSCIGCGRPSSKVLLMRLRTYSRSLCCGACFIRYANCANKNPIGTPCNHPPTEHLRKTGPCQQAGCGCDRWIHGLEGELDRQYADCVGQQARVKECESFGQNLGKCGRIIYAKPDGTLSRLCDDCEKRWVQETRERMTEIAALLDLDTDKEVPN